MDSEIGKQPELHAKIMGQKGGTQNTLFQFLYQYRVEYNLNGVQKIQIMKVQKKSNKRHADHSKYVYNLCH